MCVQCLEMDRMSEFDGHGVLFSFYMVILQVSTKRSSIKCSINDLSEAESHSPQTELWNTGSYRGKS